MRPSSQRWSRRGLVGLCLLPASVLAGVIVARATLGRWLPWAIVSANSAGQGLVVNNQGSRVTAQEMRVNVGPPPASLALLIVEPSVRVRGTVLVLHGIHDRKESMLGVGQWLARAGYRAVLVDLRGHGRSSGPWLTHGVLESRDLSQVLDELSRQGLLTGKVGVYGTSYGAATALMLAGRDDRVAAVVSVASFATMEQEVPYFVRHSARVPRWLVSDTAITRAVQDAGRLAGFDPKEASPLAAIQRTHAQVLLMHGEPDEKVPVNHSRQMHSVAPLHSQLIILPSSGHDSFCSDRDGSIMRAASACFAKWLAGPSDLGSKQ